MPEGMGFNSQIIREYGKTMFFDPVPLQFLKTAGTEPMIDVTVNGLQAVCPTFNCSFGYIDV